MAHYLKSLGVKPEALVGICIERSIEMVVGVLGILKAGGAYVPLDPDYPQERLAFMAKDSRIVMCVTSAQMNARLPATLTTVVCIDSDWPTIADANQGMASPENNVASENLAYVIYTSGSTGRPKGVQVSHGNVVNLLHSACDRPGLTADDTLLSVTTLAFDIAAAEIFLPLTVGAKVVIASREATVDGFQLLKTMDACQPTFMQPTPATWQMLLAAGWRGNQNLKMISTGESLSKELARKLLPLGGELWNMYGPTETTIWSVGHQIKAEDSFITVGYPLANTQLYVLDKHMQPVPIGVSGELHIGGAGVSGGYLYRPELTAEKFVANTVNPSCGDRLYKTGDTVRWLPNGQLEWLGRIDDQVKLRGFRIELSEVEAALVQHSQVEQALTIVREDRTDDKQLVAYIVPKLEQAIPTGELRRFAQQYLPSYMVPFAFVFLKALPLTPNGKVDRRALPQPKHTTARSVEVKPRTELEQRLVKIWESCLDIQPIGIRDNFFDLGGHSLLAVKVISDIERQTGQPFSLNELFKMPTIESIAYELTHQRVLSSSPCIIPFKPGMTNKPLFLIHTAGSGMLFYQPLVELLESNRSIYGIQPALLGDPKVRLDSVEQLADYYVSQIKRVQPHGPYLLGGASFGGIVAYEIAQQLVQQGEAVDDLILLDCFAPGELLTKPTAERYQQYWKEFLAGGLLYLAKKIKKRAVFEFIQMRKKLRSHQYQLRQKLNLTTEKLIADEIYLRHCKMAKRYVARSYPEKVSVICAEEGRKKLKFHKKDLGWSRYVKDVRVLSTPGGHMFMFKDPYVQALATQLNAILASEKK